MSKPSVTIIGTGRVGKAFSIALREAGFEVSQMYGKEDEITSLGELVFIAVPDNEIKKMSAALAEEFEDLSGKTFVHCSGTLPSKILSDLQSKGAKIGCFHPLQSVSLKTISFNGIYFDIEGEEETQDQLVEIASSLGAKWIKVSAKEKEMLHISAVIASNYLVTLSDLAFRASEATGISQRVLTDALLPLMKSSLDNLENLKPSEALTGPIARGDIQTVQKHLKLLENDEELLSIYKKLGLLTLELSGSDIKDNTIKFRLYDVLK